MAVRDVSVVWATSEFVGAPVLRGEPGSQIELLDAVLITGFCVRAFDAVTVADGVATLTMSAGNPYVQHGVIEIRGHAVSSLNRKWRVDTTGASSLTFAVDDLVPAGSHAGTGATVRYAPAGWEKPFADLGTYRAVYRSASLESTQMLLFVNDGAAQYTRVRGYESMTDIDTPGVAFPTVVQAALASYVWAKSSASGSGQTRPWAIAADPMFVHVFCAFSNSAGYEGRHSGYRFGDIERFDPADAHHCTIAAHAHAAPLYGTHGLGSVVGIAGAAGVYFARAVAGTGGAVANGVGYFGVGAGSGGAAPPGGRLNFSQLLTSTGAPGTTTVSSSPLRGRVPGILLAHERDSAIANYTVLMLSGGAALLVKVGDNTINYDGWVALEIEGPWR